MAFGSLGMQYADGLFEPCGWHFCSQYPLFECVFCVAIFQWYSVRILAMIIHCCLNCLMD